MEATTVPRYQNPATPEEIWAILRENSLGMAELRETQKETARLIQELREEQKKTDEQMRITDEQMKKTDEQMKKTDEQMKKTDRQMKRTDRQLGGLHNSFGEIAEHLVAPGIHTRFNELGYFFGEMAPRGYKIFGEDRKLKAEIDILLENGETVMAVEVKSKVTEKDVEHHIKRLEILRDHRRKKNDHRKIQGAIAGAVFGSVEKKAVIEAGLYVIEQSGDTMKIDIPDGFIPREW